ncbi:lipopolysaccharide kinase InaA family protein [Halarsenatibacter silvermanii]|uniref:Lipopolysaccharide kinase (Kdo/WaaP) family protein n=1 Tax=Halarsenatibacter silvermanii TaxID=321763 RepID=A0A1G9HZC3_9FIRM|nr:lipopolysaccharide kinase InaA family protein [Halarsenatibacter silvermanii]SDL18330.1 Lipopolysaccharide kinase (Kdo/WaaP) family protein [Halarsenatibacter silvermanii]
MKFEKENLKKRINLYYPEECNKNNLLRNIANYLLQTIWEKGKLKWDCLGHFSKIEPVKPRKKGGVLKLHYEKKVYYVKYYSHTQVSKIFKNLFRSVEGIRHFKTAERLKKRGINTVNPLLAMTFQRSFFVKDSLFVTEEIEGFSLSNYCNNTPSINSNGEKLKIAGNLGVIWAKLLNNNILHLDPKPANFFVQKDFKINLVDIDNVYFYPYLPFFMKKRSIARLHEYFLRAFNFKIRDKYKRVFLDDFTKNINKNLDKEKLKNKIEKITREKLKNKS